MSRKLILFDFDGTIADTFPVFLSFAEREGFRFDKDEIETLRDLSMREAIGRIGIPAWKLPFVAGKFHRHFRRAVGSVLLVDGMSEAIRRLRQEGYALGIVTTNSRSNVIRILEREGMISCFDLVFSERNIFGKAGALGKIVRRFGIAPETAWYVGDEVRDMEAARAAGFSSVAVTWGFNSEKALRAAKADRIASSPTDMADPFLSFSERDPSLVGSEISGALPRKEYENIP